MSQRFGCRTMSPPRSGSRAAGALLLAVLAAIPVVVLAQEKVPRRPRLSGDVDTNSAAAYYYFGLERLRADRADVAANAFYWASRLAPDWADPLYARRVALLLSRPERLVPFMDGAKSVVESPEGRYLDSLRLRALELDPFVYEDFEHQVVMRYVTELVTADLRLHNQTALRSDVEYQVRLYLKTPQAAEWRAWLAYAERRLDDAAKFYAEALKHARKDEHIYRSRLHTQRGRAFYLSGRIDSARVELERAIEELRSRDERVTIRVYESKALLEHSLGVALEKARDLAGAREAYGRALVEDLAYYPAHVRLGGLLAVAGDTAGARGEFELALEVAPGAVVARMLLANHYHGSGDYHAALTTLEPLLEREPYWAEPYLLRALALDGLGDREGAAAQYARFLERAEARDDRREAITQRLAALRSQ
jgi:tetratricopeptide (TPR) repeat protein